MQIEINKNRNCKVNFVHYGYKASRHWSVMLSSVFVDHSINFLGFSHFPPNSHKKTNIVVNALFQYNSLQYLYLSIRRRCFVFTLRWFWLKMNFQPLCNGLLESSKLICNKARMWNQFGSSGLAFIYAISSNQTPLLYPQRVQNKDYSNLFSLFSGHLSFVYNCCPCLFTVSTQHLQQWSVEFFFIFDLLYIYGHTNG